MPRGFDDDGLDFTLVGGTQLAQIASDLKRAGQTELRKKMTRELRRAAAPMVPAVRRSIASIPSSGKKSTGLRKQMARATKLAVRTSGSQTGISVKVDGSKMPDGKRTLPGHMEGSRGLWRHPVYGNRDAWVNQSSHPYFYKIMRPAGEGIRININRVMAEILREVSR